MYQVIERPMTGVERERLLGCMPLTPSPFWPFNKFQYGLQVIGEAFGVLVMIVVFVGFGDLPLFNGIAGGFGILAVWWTLNLKGRVLIPLRVWKNVNQRAQSYRSAVAAAQTVRVRLVEANAVLAVAYDDGTIYLFDVGPSQTYWIDPYCIIPGNPPTDWPNGKFEVVEVPGWNEEVGPFCYGKRLRRRETVDYRDFFEHHSFQPPADGLIHQPLEVFLNEAKTTITKMRERNEGDAV